jgi:hypothetical protein
MSKAERPKNRRVKIVGGGHRWTREPNEGSTGGAMRSKRQAEIKRKRQVKKQRRRAKAPA